MNEAKNVHGEISHEQKHYILYRRESDGYNEVLEAGPKAPSSIGIVNFRKFIEEHQIHPFELAQFLKIPFQDIEKLVNHQSWIESHARENLLELDNIPVAVRQKLCKFLMHQDGHAGMKNVHLKAIDDVEKK